ncbi:WXG100 family type VII secretion target [Priestia flexa]|uniref:WXG100 family type VII secretion target n=1 Tax=Priestia flexa TaxID=86664 RepID=UPI0011A8E865|nr:WXG100 family type VII secretion target [Priestia flexa]
MNSEQIRTLAKAFETASNAVKDEESKLLQDINAQAVTWSGKTREKFDSKMEEAKAFFQSHSDNLYEISLELEAAANSVDLVREEIERQEELARLEEILKAKNLDIV